MIELKSPQPIPISSSLKIFLAGSIEMGKAVDWQAQITNSLLDIDVLVLNPRRDSWNPCWEQSITNPQFSEQVNWELDAMELADIIVMYLDPSTISPISLLEFGQYYQSGKLLIACPLGFHRRGNLEVCCNRSNIVLLDNIDGLIKSLKHTIKVCS